MARRTVWQEADRNLEDARDNILAVIEQATEDELKEGLNWYAEARAWIADVADSTGLPLFTVTQVFAALSPGNKIDRNLQDTEALCHAITRSDAQARFKATRVGTYNANKVKAWRILHGEDALRGPKTEAFARNLAGDLEAVTVDRHAFNVAAAGRWIVSEGGPTITPRRYNQVADGYRQVADELGITPAQTQAIAWVVWRRLLEVN